MEHVFEPNQGNLLREENIFPDRAPNLMNAGERANHRGGRMAKQGGEGVVFFQ